MEIGIIIGGVLLAGGLYELFRKKRNNNFDNRDFIAFYDTNYHLKRNNNFKEIPM